jgi:hypothetical protein
MTPIFFRALGILFPPDFLVLCKCVGRTVYSNASHCGTWIEDSVSEREFVVGIDLSFHAARKLTGFLIKRMKDIDDVEIQLAEAQKKEKERPNDLSTIIDSTNYVF